MNITRKLNQTAIYWSSPVPDGYGGYTYGTPVDIAVRWEDKQELFIDLQAKERISNAIIYKETALDLNGYLYLGTIASLDSGTDLTNPEILLGAFPILKVDVTVNIKATDTLVKIWL